VSETVKTAVVLAAFAQLSLAVKVTVVGAEHPKFGDGGALFVKVTDEQSSTAEAPAVDDNHDAYCESTDEEHSTVIELAAVIKTGEVKSVIVTGAVVIVDRPQASVTVKVTGVDEHVAGREMKLFVQASEEQSVATAPPLDDNQLFTSVLSDPEEQDTERADAGVTITGDCVSKTVKIAVELAVFPQLSAAVKVTGVEAAHPEFGDGGALFVKVTDEQSSTAEAPPLDDNHEVYCEFTDEEHSTFNELAAEVKTGEVKSVIVIGAVVLVDCPQASMTVKVT